MSTVTMPHGSVEYLKGTVTADHDLDTQPVEVAVTATSHPGDDDWTVADWAGDIGTTREWRLLLDGSLDIGGYYVNVRLTDTPESPIVGAGMLWVR